MIGKTLVPTMAMAALMLLSAGTFSQPSAEGDDGTVEAAQDPDAAGGEESRPVTPPPATPPARSPTDYRSSEEISEDLSVSFPVDI